MKFGLAFSVVSPVGYDDISEDHSGSIAVLFGKFVLLTVGMGFYGFVAGLLVVLFIFIIRKISFFDSWRQGWVRIFRSKE